MGAVAGTPSKKGVFITTSDFTKGAIDYVDSLNGSPTVILINGHQLTEYIYDYGLGLQTEITFKVMKMDSDYWDSMEDLCRRKCALPLLQRQEIQGLPRPVQLIRISPQLKRSVVSV